MEKAGKEKLAETASTIGAGIIGFGLGTLLSNYFSQYTPWIILVGLVMHSIGMYKMRFEYKTTGAKILYWLCWIILFGLAVYLATII